MSPAGFEPTILKSKRPQTLAIDRATSGIGIGSFKNVNTASFTVTLLHTYLWILDHNSFCPVGCNRTPEVSAEVWSILYCFLVNIIILSCVGVIWCQVKCYKNTSSVLILNVFFFFLSNAPHVRDGLRGLPSWAWQKCNRLLRLGRPWGAVTLSRWCEWWYRRM